MKECGWVGGATELRCGGGGRTCRPDSGGCLGGTCGGGGRQVSVGRRDSIRRHVGTPPGNWFLLRCRPRYTLTLLCMADPVLDEFFVLFNDVCGNPLALEISNK